MNVLVLYSPLPDEQPEASAAYEYSKRLSNIFHQNGDGEETLCKEISIHRLSMDSLNFTKSEDYEASQFLRVFIILSCSADGSVDRIVRKLVRSLKNDAKTEKMPESSLEDQSISPKTMGRIAIVLLGHARCDNSAQQMNDTIFNIGRKLYQCLLQKLNSSKTDSGEKNWHLEDRLETQVELEGPDTPDGFDEWVKKNMLRHQ